ncbi:MAG: hypothetical protein QGH45_10030, partial [Myxococcota bacterium]|nr:hypothetical protein [Myxococcota bacterium]
FVRDLVSNLKPRIFTPGDYVVTYGEMGAEMFFIHRGRVQVIGEDDVEGIATKSFEQFRLTLDYPRPTEDTFYACLISMASKGFIPRSAVRALARSDTLRAHPTALRYGAEAANAVKLGTVAMKMLRRGELSVFKLAEYASFRRRLIQ